jgi:pyridoxamine 5'-phosphate oxidase-like protein
MPATTDQVWRELDRASFAVICYVTPAGEPRSSGVVYAVDGRRLYVVTAADSWKARDIPARGLVSVTVPVRRGGPLAFVFPIPPETISFIAAATVRPAGALDKTSPRKLAALVPPDRRAWCSVIELRPIGRFVTYGVGVTLAKMRDPVAAKAHVAIA